MALFSFRHSTKTFSAKRRGADREAKVGQTAAHLRYITRDRAARVVLRARVENSDRKTAKHAEASAQKRRGRVAERFIIALPSETTPDEREQLGRAFANNLTHGKAGYVLAIHDKSGNDRRNPHMHLIAFDAFESSGGRGRPRSVLGMARKGAVERTAAMWAKTHNQMMNAWGYAETSMISHQSNEARGIDRIPTIHEGPTSRKMAKEGKCPQSKPEWRKIDCGHSRRDANSLIRKINKLKEETENEGRDHRLGGDNESNEQARETSWAEQRPNTGRSCGSPTQSKTPIRGTHFASKNSRRIGTELGGNNYKTRPPHPATVQDTKELSKHLDNHPPFLRRCRERHFRCFWHNLIILRDTLLARNRCIDRPFDGAGNDLMNDPTTKKMWRQSSTKHASLRTR